MIKGTKGNTLENLSSKIIHFTIPKSYILPLMNGLREKI